MMYSNSDERACLGKKWRLYTSRETHYVDLKRSRAVFSPYVFPEPSRRISKKNQLISTKKK